jgi:hypothetical protein
MAYMGMGDDVAGKRCVRDQSTHCEWLAILTGLCTAHTSGTDMVNPASVSVGGEMDAAIGAEATRGSSGTTGSLS